MDFSTIPPELLQQMLNMAASGKFKIPPPIFLEMDGEFVDVDMARKSIALRFPVQERFQNPLGYMQGGMIATALDNAIGPLSFMVAPPSVTKKMEVRYLKPISAEIDTIIASAIFDRREEHNLYFTAKVTSADGNVTFAEATSHNVILKEK